MRFKKWMIDISSRTDFSKILKGSMQEMAVKFQKVKFKRSRRRTLTSERGEYESMFLILIWKFGMQDSRFS